MIYISEYRQICLSQSNHLTPFSAIKDHQRFRLKYFCKYAPLVFRHFSLSINIFDNMFESFDHMMNLSDCMPTDNCLNSHLMPSSGPYNHRRTRNKNFCMYIPFIFPLSSMLSSSITTLSHMIYAFWPGAVKL